MTTTPRKIGEYSTTGKPLPTGAAFFREYDKESPQLPTSATSALHNSYQDLGELDENGVAENHSVSRSVIKGWSNVPILTTLDEYSTSYAITPMEVKKSVIDMIFGESTGSDGNALDYYDSPKGVDKTYTVVLIMLLEDKRIWRKVIPKCTISSLNSTNFKNGEAVTFPIELQALVGGFEDNPKATARNFISAPNTWTDPSSSSSSSSSTPA